MRGSGACENPKISLPAYGEGRGEVCQRIRNKVRLASTTSPCPPKKRGGRGGVLYFNKPSPGAEPGLPGSVSEKSSFLDCLSFGTYTRSRMMLSSAQLYMKIGAPGATLAKRLLMRRAPG